ncbi:MAG: pectinesterase family protein [Bacteroidales bacterium]|nr:pectinesterase family protein [Bacteroidales bacterium]
MKTLKLIFLGALALTAMACTHKPIENTSAAVSPAFTGGVTGTKAVGTLWYGDKIGVTVTSSPSSDMYLDYVNVGYYTDAQGVALASFYPISDEIQFEDDEETVTFAAYAPYSETESASVLPGNSGILSASTAQQPTSDDQQALDYLYVASPVTGSAASPNVRFTFNHVMSQLTVYVVAGEGFTDDEIQAGSYYLSGLIHEGEFDVNPADETCGTAYATGTSTVDSWSLGENAYVDTAPETGSVAFSCILYPQSPESLDLSTEVGGLTLSGLDLLESLSDSQLKAGYSYYYTVTVARSGLSLSGSGINDWNNEYHSGSLGGDEVESAYTLSPSGEGAYTDGELTITFESAPTLGTTGLIKIWEAGADTSTDDPVDYIDMADVAAGISQMNKNTTTLNTAMDVLSACAGSSDRYRVVWYNAVEVNDNTVTIRPHSSVLDFGTSYFVTVDAQAISHDDFYGITSDSEWTFTTKAAPSSATSISVAKSGDADFRTVQGALTYGCTAGKDTQVTISVADGTYEEQLFLRDKNNVTIKGTSTDGTILQYCNSNDWQNGVGQGISDGKPEIGGTLSQIGGRCVILIESCDNIRFENMTLTNTWSEAKSQAEVFYFNSSYRLAFVNCILSSRQDTLESKGYNWFYNCTVNGNVDYVWGSASACLFENCTINTVCDSDYDTAYLVQARCSAATDYGYVYLNCAITADEGVPDGTVYLARSAGSSEYYDNVAYINCDLSGAKLASVGWYTNPASNPETATATSGWKYYAGDYTYDVSGWGACCYRLSADDVAEYYPDRNTILAGSGSTSWLTE